MPAGATNLAVLIALQSQMLVGGFDAKHKWISSEAAGRRLKGGEPVEVFDLSGRLGDAKLAKPVRPDEANGPAPEWEVGVDFDAKISGLKAFATSSRPAVPRRVIALPPTTPTYRTVVSDWLKAKGMNGADIRLANVTKVDLDGDGTDEVIISANPGGDYLTAHFGKKVRKPRSYSLVLIRKIVKGTLKTIEVHSAVETMEVPVYNHVELQGVADLDGDGKMELITSFDYYEGQGHCVFRVDGAKATQVGCEGFGA